MLLSRKKDFQSAHGESPLLLRRVNRCFVTEHLASLGEFLSHPQASPSLLKYICFFTLQKTFSQPAHSSGCTKQLYCCLVIFTNVSSQRIFTSPQGNTLSTLAYRMLVKDFFLPRMMFQIVFCFCHILFFYPKIKMPADFICHSLFIFFFSKNVSAMSNLPIEYVCLRVAEVIIGHSEDFCKL